MPCMHALLTHPKYLFLKVERQTPQMTCYRQQQQQQLCPTALPRQSRSINTLQPVLATSNGKSSKTSQQQQVTPKNAPLPNASPASSKQHPSVPPQQQQEPAQSQRLQAVLSWSQQKWKQLTLLQRAYTVVASVAIAATLPKVLTLVVLLLERALIGGLLLIEEVLLELLLKGGALLGLLGVVALIGAGVYVFAQKTTK